MSLNYLWAGFLLWFGWSCHSGYTLPEAPAPRTSQGFFTRVDSLVFAKMNQYALPGVAVGIVRDGVVVYTAGYGTANLATGQPVTAESIFHTASVSKLFTAQAVIELVRQGQLELEDHLRDLAPELQFADEAAGEITVTQLLNHTAGLPDVRNYHWARQRRDENSLQHYVQGLKLRTQSPPGTAYRYSNLGYEVLGYLIERTAGVSFETYLTQNVLAPSGMVDSDFRYFAIADSLRTAPHTRKGRSGKLRLRRTYPYTREHAPSSTLNASVSELSRWMIRTLDQLATDEDYQRLITPSTPVYDGIGLGFQLGTLDGHRTAGHYGGDRGFRGYLLLLPEQHIGLVVLANTDHAEDFRQDILHTIARRMLTSEEVP